MHAVVTTDGAALKKKVVLCIPIYSTSGAPRPHAATLESLRDSVPLLESAGWEHGVVHEVNCPYISVARATMLRKALDAKATHVVFIDSDVSWRPEDLIKLLDTEGDVACGTYRFKLDEEKYMGCAETDAFGRPIVRESDGALRAFGAPAGFLRITRESVNLMMQAWPELVYGETCYPHLDLFQHGAHKGCWYGEDMAFCRRWTELGKVVWLVPDMNVDHHSGEKVFKGNYHRFLRRQPGGSESDCPVSPAQLREQTLAKIAKNKAA